MRRELPEKPPPLFQEEAAGNQEASVYGLCEAHPQSSHTSVPSAAGGRARQATAGLALSSARTTCSPFHPDRILDSLQLIVIWAPVVSMGPRMAFIKLIHSSDCGAGRGHTCKQYAHSLRWCCGMQGSCHGCLLADSADMETCKLAGCRLQIGDREAGEKVHVLLIFRMGNR